MDLGPYITKACGHFHNGFTAVCWIGMRCCITMLIQMDTYIIDDGLKSSTNRKKNPKNGLRPIKVHFSIFIG